MAPPINDNLADAVDILLSVPTVVKETIAGTTVDATGEANFEDHSSYGGSPAVWYHIAPAEDYRFAWRITKTGGTSGWLPGADLIRCITYPPTDADDFDWVDFFGDGTTTPPYQHQVKLLAGEHYLIAVNEYNYDVGEEGDFDLDIQAVPGYLFESWEDGSIDPIVWERRIISASPDDPNTGSWTIETDEVFDGTYSLKSTPTTVRQQLHHHDTAQGGDTDRDYWMAYKFFITDWNDILTSDSEQVDMPCITNGNNTSFPHGGTGLIASAFQTYLYADTSTTGFYEDNDSGANYLTTGWHELRVKYRKRSSDNHLIIKEILDGVTIVNDVDFGVFAGSITGVSWTSTDGAYTSGPLYIDPLVWSPDTDPGSLDPAGSIAVPKIDAATSVYTPALGNFELEFIDETTTVFDPSLYGDQGFPAPFISPTTTVYTPSVVETLRARVSQLPVEVVHSGAPEARVSQMPVEVVHSGSPKARVSQVVVEVVVQNTTENFNAEFIVFRPRGAE